MSGGPICQGCARSVWLTVTPPSPLFFVSVDSKWLNTSISPFFSTLTSRPTSVVSKGGCAAPELCRSSGLRADIDPSMLQTVQGDAIKRNEGAGLRILARVFSKLNCTKGITKVKGKFRSGPVSGERVNQAPARNAPLRNVQPADHKRLTPSCTLRLSFRT